MVVVITFGTFDLLHVGHLRLLKRAKNSALNSTLIVGVSSDSLNIKKKGRIPVYTQEERVELLLSLKYVDSVFIEDSLELKPEYLKQFKADILVMGDDWKGKFDYCKDIKGLEGLEIIYLPRTPSVSTTETIESIVKN
jgi:glycerol-3-phosphate cytidylyltransferase